MKRIQHQSTSADKCVMSPQHHSDEFNPSLPRNHWASFKDMLYFKQERVVSIPLTSSKPC